MRFSLPRWTPGSYVLRDYVRCLETLIVSQGNCPLAVQRRDPSAWSVSLAGQDPVLIRYRILATELTVRTCHLNGEHGFLALAAVVMQVEGERWSPHRLTLSLPEGWQSFVPLPEDGEGRWLARNYDQLVDSPVEVGPHPCHSFSVAGVPHRWVSWGGDLPQNDPDFLRDVERICYACCALMGEDKPAADSYLFILHLLDQGYGGLEHDFSSVLQYGRRALRKQDGRRKLLQLVAHEYLHQWNVRRLRPIELTPIDYDQPSIVPSLWFSEGITSYFDELLPVAAGIADEDDLLRDLGDSLSRFRLTPGRHVQSLRLSSQEAWVKLYRRDAYSADNQVSYYLKGAVLAFVLDLHLRRQKSCLATVLRLLWCSHGRWGRGFREADLIDAFSSQAEDLSILLPEWLECTDDLDIDNYLMDIGLCLKPKYSTCWFLGWTIDASPGRGLKLKTVNRHGPAEAAGLEVGDELIALDDLRLLDVEQLASLLQCESGVEQSQSRSLTVCRDGRIRQLSIKPTSPAIASWQLAVDSQAPTTCQERRKRWLSLAP